ncbi:MAG: prepilin-type N-terminal cleavage/methylation domain-containing protein [Planctomycetia bacterium]|nr:prepilin-type N-terminal cleavage/methylation domain-containing protein [Planctomycetia bacterium]
MNRSASRSAFTLLELLVVISIIAVVVGMATLSLRSMYGPYKITAAVDSVRAAWALARSRAVDEDRPYRFSIEPNGRHFRIAPDSEPYWAGGAAPANDPDGSGIIKVDSLPPGVRFTINGDGNQAPPSDADLPDEKTPPSGQWETVCVILPDGTSRQDVRIVFQVRGGAPTQLQLRGMTGVSYVTKVK